MPVAQKLLVLPSAVVDSGTGTSMCIFPRKQRISKFDNTSCCIGVFHKTIDYRMRKLNVRAHSLRKSDIDSASIAVASVGHNPHVSLGSLRRSQPVPPEKPREDLQKN